MNQHKIVLICGIDIYNVSFQETLDQIEEYISSKVPLYIVTPNTDHIVRLQRDLELKMIYEKASLVLADGMPLIWAAKYLDTPLKEKISGSDLFPKICEKAATKGYRLFFLGGKTDAAAKTADFMKTRYLGIQIVGTYCPPFGFENDNMESDKIINMIKDAKPDILFIGVGSPKQEKWIYKHKEEYRVPISLGIGATFDFVSGMVRRAPVWMQKTGLEWFWRLIMEPGRLWKRYLIDDPVFFWLVLKQKYDKRSGHEE